jgi:outer membrane biosynthesis protein TonB
MDTITKKSAIIATSIHGVLLALTFFPGGCSTKPPESALPPRQTPTPVPEPINTQKNISKPSEIIAVPARATDASHAAPLPTLSARDLPSLPPLPALNDVITAVKQDRPAQQQATGEKNIGTAPVDLPVLPAANGDLSARLRGQKTSNKELSREQRMLASAQEFLDGRLQHQIRQHWSHLIAKVTEPRLIIEIRVNERGQLTLAQLVNSSGSLTLDRLIDEWLQKSNLSLPPITANVIYPFLVVINQR